MGTAIRKGRLVPSLLATAAIACLALAPAADATKNETTPTKKCTAGDVKEETTTVTVNGQVVSTTTVKKVCNKQGQWRTVSNLIADSGAFAPADSATQGGVAGANAKPNGDAGEATCSGGGKLGEVRPFTREVWLNGRLIKKETIKAKCGADGKWRPLLMPSTPDAEPQVATQGGRS